MANFAAVRVPPPRLLLAISQPKIKLQNRHSNPTGQASLLLASVFFYRTIIITEVDDDGMITLLHNHPDSGRRFPRRRNDEGRTGGLMTKAETAARR